ncbi:leucine-rich repeat-containing protein 75A-like [Chanos chanos]|uniref:Leucine-rich repeat-containing protein 75A-like n=1 Tax=Chanos chanos TaxID=29144 RepID=A0A6J2WX85_CHACN|nr:leucine-rich repeat-containing protein 75A [Chanos chanos]
MGGKPSKGGDSEAGASPLRGVWRRAQSSLLLRSSTSDHTETSPAPAPYQRRVSMVKDVLRMAREGKQEEAMELLKTLRQDLGMESTSLDDVLYRYASFRNMVDPITHDLLISLARYIHCLRTEGDALNSMEKVCRQLTYHLSPHPRWKRHGLLKDKTQVSLKAVLSVTPVGGMVDLSGIPLSSRDMERLVSHLSRNAAKVQNLELGFTELTDESLLLLLPTLASLPRLESLALNGNHLTRAILRQLTDTLKDPASFPALAWIDLGNNVDIFSLPQPFLLSLRKRCPKQGNLPTIQEQGEAQASESESRAPGLGSRTGTSGASDKPAASGGACLEEVSEETQDGSGG